MRAPTPCRSLDELPLEVKLRFVENCDLSALVKLHTLSKTWRALLLDFYDLCLDSEYFRRPRRHIVKRLTPFHRDGYIQSWLSDPSLPEEFEMWLREWPSKAVIG
ncbi:hypothetical protein GTA08_BOTSDO06590 [Botryosphaeria dothidea]|uniref:F-box domain-containing protein n=1 Tax=Botryosphaeria dothidea TaxID=55169 RepID=A0A8H4IQM0_9PEZI|nr:hypothetical protein GTA08_BOTSDO06590 [Botryosphaeria dothidea]